MSVQASNPDLLERGTVRIVPGNVLGEMLADEKPFDVIHVGAAAAKLPEMLIDKLAVGGRMVCPSLHHRDQDAGLSSKSHPS